MKEQKYISPKTKTQLLPPLGYIQADCGTGKSYQSIKQVIHHSRFSVQLVVCNTIKLLEQWKTDLILNGFNPERIKIFHSDNCDNVNSVVTATILNFCGWSIENKKYTPVSSCEGSGSCPIILFPFATLLKLNFRVPDYENRGYLDINRSIRSQVNLWVDELPSVDEKRGVKVKNNPHEIQQWLKLGEVVATTRTEIDGKKIQDSVHKVVAKDNVELQNELWMKSNNYHDSTRKLLMSVVGRNENVYVKKSQWDLMAHRLDKKVDSDNGETNFISILHKGLLSGWGSITFISADFNRSRFSHGFSYSKFIPHRVTKSKLLNSGHHSKDLLKRVRFVYAMKPKNDGSEQLNSKRYLEMNGEDLDQKFMKLASELNQPFLFCTNKSRQKDRKILEHPDCKVITSAEHGNNSFSSYNVLFFDCALRPKPGHESMLNLLGFDREILHTDLFINSLYQTTCRTSIRDSNSNEIVTIVCMEKSSAVEIATRLAGAEINTALIRHIDEPEYSTVEVIPYKSDSYHSEGKPSVANAPKNGKSPLKSTTKGIFADFAVGEENFLSDTFCRKFPNSSYKSNSYHFDGRECNPPATPHAVGDCSRPAQGLTIFPKISTKNPVFVEASILKQIAELREAAQQLVSDRAIEGYRFTPAIFNRAVGTRAKRDKASFSHAHMVVLDFDGNSQPDHKGSMTKDDFVRIFNPKSKRKNNLKLSFAITNTFNTCGTNHYKFRVFIFLKEPVTSPEQYRATVELIETHIVDAGYKDSGLDPMSKNAVQIYWMPCTNTRHKQYAFFETHNCCESRDIQRYGLTPLPVTKQPQKPLTKPQYRPKVNPEFCLDTAITKYRSLTDNRRFGLKELGTRCATQGAMFENDVEQVLLSVVEESDSEMMKRVSDTMTQLRNEVRWW